MTDQTLDTLTQRLDRQERENRRLGLAGFAMVLAIPAVVLIIVTPTPAAALCIPPVEAANTAPVSYRYAWFLTESLTRASLAWQEADSAADAQDAVTKLAGFKLAIEDFQCAASLVQQFQSTRASDEHTKSLRASAAGATLAYTKFVSSFQQRATALARGEGLTLEEAADLKVENEKAAEFLIKAVGVAVFALLKPPPDPVKPVDRLNLTRAQRAALLEGLRRRFPTSDVHTPTEGDHSPELAAKVLNALLSNPRYKAADEQ